MEMARDYILHHFHENISLNQIAQHCLMSPFHFSRIFKKIVNQSPHQYLTGIRLNHARYLLANTEKPIGDIAFESGFNSMEHFATVYRMRYQMRPSDFRRQLA
jgi:AraC-like DNA-binding protein